MKRLIAVLIIMVGLMWVPFAGADDSTYATYLSAKTATGAGTEVAFLNPVGRFSCTATWGGTAPTSITFWVQLTDATGVYDATNGDAVVTMTASPWRFYIVNKAAKFARGNYISKVGGDGTTSITLNCNALR